MIARALRQAGILFALALAPALVSGALQLKLRDAPPQDEVTRATAEAWGGQVIWVDARAGAKFAAGHIPGALLLNEDEWDKLVPAFLDAWEPGRQVIVYCDGGSCDASHAVAQRLRDELKLENVHVLKGGWQEWSRR